MQSVVIIGNGIAGITAARFIRKYSDCQITVISAESKFFWSRTALMYIYMGHMKFEHTKPYEDWFWEKNKINLLHDYVKAINPGNQTISCEEYGELAYDKLIIATGSKPNRFNWTGQDLNGVCTMVTLQDLENIEQCTKKIKKAVIVGGGLIGVELAEMLTSKGISVTILVKDENFWGNVLPPEDADLVEKEIRRHGVQLKFNTELASLHGHGKVAYMMTKGGEQIDCEFVGLTAGVHPNIKLAQDCGIETNKGILVDDLLQTSLPNIYAAGDCAEMRHPKPGRSAIEPVWYVGALMGERLGINIGSSTPVPYDPGPWFNSAKFFTLEYQTYGVVKASLHANENAFYWESNDEMHAIHVVFQRDSGQFLGINTFGIRLRHQYFDQWLRNNATITEVLDGLKQANFDAEFSHDDTAAIKTAFNQQYPEFKVPIKKKNKIFNLMGL